MIFMLRWSPLSRSDVTPAIMLKLNVALYKQKLAVEISTKFAIILMRFCFFLLIILSTS